MLTSSLRLGLDGGLMLGLSAMSWAAFVLTDDAAPAPVVSTPVVDEYHGKYAGDPLFTKRVQELKEALHQAASDLASRFAQPETVRPSIRIRLEDAGATRRPHGMTVREEVHGTGEVQVLTVVTEYLAVGMSDLRRIATHEAWHCMALANSTADQRVQPRWLTEGIALWVAGEGEDLVRKLADRCATSPEDPSSVIESELKLLGGEECSLAIAFLAVEFVQSRLGETERESLAAEGLVGRPPEERLLEKLRMTKSQLYGAIGERAKCRVQAHLKSSELYVRARSLFLRRDYVAAGAVYEKFCEEHPSHSLASRALGEWGACLYHLGRYTEARGLIEQASQEWPQGPFLIDVAQLRAIIACELEDASAARAQCERFLRDYSYCSDRYLDPIRERLATLGERDGVLGR